MSLLSNIEPTGVTEVDEESIDADLDEPVLRMFQYDRQGSSWACGVHEIAGAEVSAVLSQAR